MRPTTGLETDGRKPGGVWTKKALNERFRMNFSGSDHHTQGINIDGIDAKTPPAKNSLPGWFVDSVP